jgi:hypothetical protein
VAMELLSVLSDFLYLHLLTRYFADRLENEQIGNIDQYRIIREVPLPYSFDEVAPGTDGEDHDGELGKLAKKR